MLGLRFLVERNILVFVSASGCVGELGSPCQLPFTWEGKLIKFINKLYDICLALSGAQEILICVSERGLSLTN